MKRPVIHTVSAAEELAARLLYALTVNPTAYMTACLAVRLNQERPAEPLRNCITLADMILDILTRHDEPRFSAEDYADALLHHSMAPSFSVLIEKYPEDPDLWDELVIAMAADKRATYEGQSSSQEPVIREHLEDMGLDPDRMMQPAGPVCHADGIRPVSGHRLEVGDRVRMNIAAIAKGDLDGVRTTISGTDYWRYMNEHPDEVYTVEELDLSGDDTEYVLSGAMAGNTWFAEDLIHVPEPETVFEVIKNMTQQEMSRQLPALLSRLYVPGKIPTEQEVYRLLEQKPQ